jgi:hypothetical protein
MKVKGVNVYERGPFPASDVIVDCDADQNIYGKFGCQELLSLLLNWLNYTQQAFK